MTQHASFLRKVIYIAAIAVLLLPLSWLSAPATRSATGEQQPGGQLAQMRAEYGLSQANLGEIDPASATMRLALMGMTGVAVNQLQLKAIEYKKVEDWESLIATLKQIRNLAPNFVDALDFQGHNLSYNVSVEFDDYRRRYHWVKRGIDFLMESTPQNSSDPKLRQTIGWYFGQKIGRSDEQKYFRRLYRDDQDFHEVVQEYVNLRDAYAYGKPDNWLTGRLWFLDAENLVDRGAGKIRGKSPLIFYSHAPMAQINFAGAAEDDGYLEEQALLAWVKAGDEWRGFGGRQIPTSWGHNVRLNDYESTKQEEAELIARIDALAPGLREELAAERRAALTDAQRDALDTPEDQRTDEQFMLAYEAAPRTYVWAEDVAARAPAAVRTEAQALAARAADKRMLAERISRYRMIVDFENWRLRCEVESQPTTLDARRLLYEAKQAIEVDSDLVTARDKYEAAWLVWADIFERYPVLLGDITGVDLMDEVKEYIELVERQQGDDVPDDFPLWELVAEHERSLLPARYSSRRRPDASAAAEPSSESPAPPVEASADDPRAASPRPPAPPVELAPVEAPLPAEPRAAAPRPPVPPADSDADE